MTLQPILRPAIPEDIAWIVAQEQRSEFEAFIGHWPAETHLKNLADPDKRYLMATDEAGQPGLLRHPRLMKAG
ncbi:MAG TPA: hypothetical protein PKZ53_22150, partial [Acidobacteriota bacterium]|nr:hypothetical protein [Acidobacteriota bacterium]